MNKYLLNNNWYPKIIHGLMMLRDKRIQRKIVVFESDDWGSVRIPSLETRNRLIHQGVSFAMPNTYDCFDTLASNDDLELLMDVLSSVKDSNSKPAKITLNTCVANPDFHRIADCGFENYFFEPFTETLKRYPHHDRAFKLWKEGMDHGVFRPQFHGREHLNPQKWLKILRRGDKPTTLAFHEGCYSVATYANNREEFFLEAYNVESEDECGFARQSIREGMEMFESLFGFRSESMIAPCYTWDNYVEDEAFKMGVRSIQGGYIQKHSLLERQKGNPISGHYFGEKNKNGQLYLIRNCSFEPSQYSNNNALSCFGEITKAFRYHVPAIISCHRLNFIGELTPHNRDNNLKEFKKLLEMIVRAYPDVEFMSSEELGKY